ncbi:hypothetical protein [Streptomyces sp. NPDC049555]|uniref:hypothetical protein n=1 Tax=Streptomyces sp. NPDC049555 TaxID=3154930 RepID=UPI00341339F6
MEYPEIKTWADGFTGDLDHVDFLTQHATPAVWLAMSRVFWPRFVEAGECVLWERAYSRESFEEWHRVLGGDARRIEATLNRLVLLDVIPEEDTAECDTALLEVAGILARTWRAALDAAFPGRPFTVRVDDSDDGPVVCFVSGSVE